jgi:ATP-binding cassette subfamily B multidrug efflux pump
MSVTDAHEDESEKSFDLKLSLRLLRYARPYRKDLGLAAVLLLLITIAELLKPLLVRHMIDTSSKGDTSGILKLAWLYLGSLLWGFALQTWQTIQTKGMGQKIMLDLREELFRKIHAQSMRFFDKNPVGALMTRVIYDVETLNQFFTAGLSAVFQDFFTLLVAAAILLYMDWRLGLLALSMLPILATVTLHFRRQMRESYRKARAMTSRLNTFLSENLSGVPTIQSFVREKKNAEQFDTHNKENLRVLIEQITLNALFRPLAELLAALAIGLAWEYGAFRVLKLSLDLGSIVATIMYIQRFFEPLNDLADKFNILQAAMASSERIFALLDREDEIVDSVRGLELAPRTGSLEFKDVYFAYDEERWVLKHLSFRIAAGERVAVVGPTGAGKTSLTNILYRFYPFQRGEVLLDGRSIADYSRDALRRKMALVPQDPFLFSGSILENLRLSQSAIPKEKVRWAAVQTQADTFIQKLPGNYDFELKEGGANLSTGQKQLLAFARALVFDPLLLVLDEATASVDTQTEHELQTALEGLLKGRSSLTVAHRLSTVISSDRILVLQGGELVEEGRHDELMRRDGLYRSLIELQFKEVA